MTNKKLKQRAFQAYLDLNPCSNKQPCKGCEIDFDHIWDIVEEALIQRKEKERKKQKKLKKQLDNCLDNYTRLMKKHQFGGEYKDDSGMTKTFDQTVYVIPKDKRKHDK